MANWRCISGCGACCHLDPGDRPELATYLTPDELQQYLNLVGPDGWCIHFDQATRRCQIYETRPEFCRVQAETFSRLFGIQPAELAAFASDCCQQQIAAVYGSQSPEQQRFAAAIAPPESDSI